MQRERLSYILIPLTALIAVLPFLLHGCSCGHDFDFHIVSWLDAARQFAHGNLHPRWAYTAAYNAGEPRFVFYPPLSWTLGALIGLTFPWTWAPTIYTWLALSAAGLAMHRLARGFASQAAALIAAVLYTVNPYILFTAYERTAYAELLAAAWIPLLLHAVLRRRITIAGLAVPVALLWLTNAPAAVMGCYALALLALVRLATETWFLRGPDKRPNHATPVETSLPPRQIARDYLAGTTLGLAVAGAYILPAAYERRLVQTAMAVLPGMRIADNFLFTHTPDAAHDTVLHSASIIAVVLLSLTALFLVAAAIRAKETHSRLVLPALATLIAAIAFMQTPPSLAVWKHVPDLIFLQFPWRMIAILTPVLFLTIAMTLDGVRWRTWAIVAALPIVAAVMVYPAYDNFRQDCDPEDTVAAQLAAFHTGQGSEPTDEYTPVTADNDSLAQANPPYWITPDANAKATSSAAHGPTPQNFSVDSPFAQSLIVNLRDYPAWQVRINGQLADAREQRDDGLIALPIHAGRSDISIKWKITWDEATGEAISGVALLILLFCSRGPLRTRFANTDAQRPRPAR